MNFSSGLHYIHSCLGIFTNFLYNTYKRLLSPSKGLKTEAVAPRCSVERGALRNFTGFPRKQQSLFFNKFAGLSANLFKKRHWHRCFRVNFAKFIKRPFFKKTSGGCFCKDENILTKKTLPSKQIHAQSQQWRQGEKVWNIFKANDVNSVVLVSLMLRLNIFLTFFNCFYCWLSTGK